MLKTDDAWLKKSLVLAGLMALAGAMSACDVTVQGGAYGGGGPYLQAWYDVYGNHCADGTPHAGCDFYWDGSKLTAGSDPYYNSGAMMQYATWQYTDPYGYQQYYTGYAWLSPDGILFDANGYALNQDGDQGSRDLIGDVSAQEQQVVSKVGKDFAAKYALSEATGVQIARTLNEWATLSKRQGRARTAADVADFSTRLYGISIDKAVKALTDAKNGDLAGLNAANGDIATYWGTSPETSKTILKNWYKGQLSEFNAQ